MDLTGNTIVVTGATSGIGRALANALSDAGNVVIAVGRRAERLAEICARRPGIVPRQADLTSVEDRELLVAWVLEHHPSVNMLVNNAGIQCSFDATVPVDPYRLRQEAEINLIAPVHLVSLFSTQLAHKPNAYVINVTSGLAYAPAAAVGFYSATKAALHSMTLSLRRQYRAAGIGVIEIAPPAVDTELGVDPGQSHGGMPTNEFIKLALAGLATGDDEIAVGPAARMKADPDAMFKIINA